MTTRRGDKLYVHILDLEDQALFIPLAGKKVKKAISFKDKSPVRFTNNWKLPFLIISIQKTLSCMLHALMQMVVCLNLSSQKKMPLFQMP